MIPYGRQTISDPDLAAVAATLQSGWLTTGPKVAEFEEQFAERVGAKHAIAVNNGTSALHLAMLVADVGIGDRVVTSPNTFLASANCAAFVGATPDFADIDPVSYTLCPEALGDSWQHGTKAVIAVDYAGQTANMPDIAEIARERGSIVVEDACHAVGGRFEHHSKIYNVGGHPWADITTYSFHPVKTMTTGEGGMLVTNSDELATKARTLRHHGMVREPDSCTGLGDSRFDEKGPWYYEMPSLGFNFRITDFQCALGISQLGRLEEFCERRREIVAQYNQAFGSLEHVQIPRLRNEADRELTSWHLYTLMINFAALGSTRTDVMVALREKGVGTQVLYIPVHLQPWYRQTYGYRVGKCPVAEEQYLRSLSLPLYPAMSDKDVDTVIREVLSCIESSST